MPIISKALNKKVEYVTKLDANNNRAKLQAYSCAMAEKQVKLMKSPFNFFLHFLHMHVKNK